MSQNSFAWIESWPDHYDYEIIFKDAKWHILQQLFYFPMYLREEDLTELYLLYILYNYILYNGCFKVHLTSSRILVNSGI